MKKLTHISTNPSTTVLIARAIVSRGKNGIAGSGAQEARDRIWHTMDTYNQETKKYII